MNSLSKPAKKSNEVSTLKASSNYLSSARLPAEKDKNAKRPNHPLGTQTIHRAVKMLREIATQGHDGLRLVDLAAALELERPTTHRIAKGLMSQGMLTQDRETKRYRLGHVVYELGLAGSPFGSLKNLCQPTLQRLAEKTGDSVFLIVRSGLDSVCIDTSEGSFPIKARTLDVGTRRPLGVGAGSLALLMELSEPEIEQAIAANAPRFAKFGSMTAERMRKAIVRSRAAGYALNDEDVLPGVAAIGTPIHSRLGRPYAAVSIAGITSRVMGERRKELVQMLLKEVRGLEKKLEALDVSWD